MINQADWNCPTSADWPQFMAEDYMLYKVQRAINSPSECIVTLHESQLCQKTPVYFCSPNQHDLLFCFSIDPRIQTTRGNTHFGYQIIWQNTPARITWHQNPMALFPYVRAGTLSYILIPSAKTLHIFWISNTLPKYNS